jgi:pantoate kinase
MVIDDYLASARAPWEVLVDHTCPLPIASGYGTSGAGAASLSLALNNALGEPCSRSAALRIAHIAEVKARTGLGTVASESIGGLAVRVTPGAPGIGRVEKLAISGSSRVVSGTFGPIPTMQILSSKKLRDRVNSCSVRLVGNLLRKPDAGNFMRLSRGFTTCLGLASSRLRRFLEMAETQGIGASMMMVGEGAFCIAPVEALEMAEKLFQWGGLSPTVSRIYSRGAHLV